MSQKGASASWPAIFADGARLDSGYNDRDVSKLRRREFLRRSAGAVGAAATLALLPPAIRRALAVDPLVDAGTIQDVKHVVILMQENRSFDHYFGTLRGVRGFGDRFPVPLQSGKPVWFQSDGSREITPYHLDPSTTSALLVPDTPHSFADTQAAWNQGKFGEWPRYKTGYSMGHYRRGDIPFQFALAEAFTICDAYHCSVTTGTDPNRIVFWSGSNFNPELRKAGINCTDQDSEPNNLRCWIKGKMPSPGYTYAGSSFKWPTLPELLESAGVTWRIYQNPNDNWTGAMHGCLAFESFRKATAASGSPLYENGMRHWSLDDLRRDVSAGTLPAVSWVLPSARQSEHPAAQSSPQRGGSFAAQVLDALTVDADSWSKTVFILTFDENDGFFDHVPPPAVPSYDAGGSLAGKSTVPLDGEYFSDPAGSHLDSRDTISGRLRPWGLGPRVPAYIVSPWSKGGWVNSQVFDHTSVAMFLEKRFGIHVDGISPWHRAVCGDLSSAFDFSASAGAGLPTLPHTVNVGDLEARQRKLPLPMPPADTQALFQETGTRYSRALPYELHVRVIAVGHEGPSLEFANTGAQGAVFHVYDRLHLERIPRRYTVEAGMSLTDSWAAGAGDPGRYDLWVLGPNGFMRGFSGAARSYSKARFRPEIRVAYDRTAGRLVLNVLNAGDKPGRVAVRANAYRDDGPWEVEVAAKGTGMLSWDLGGSGEWYDFTVESQDLERRFSGRMETGKHGVSDPQMAAHLSG